jgi:hypothetical protein
MVDNGMIVNKDGTIRYNEKEGVVEMLVYPEHPVYKGLLYLINLAQKKHEIKEVRLINNSHLPSPQIKVRP